MSSAANVDKNLKAAISFKIEGQVKNSGMMFFISNVYDKEAQEQNVDIMILRDGGDLSEEVGSLAELNQALKGMSLPAIQLNAICVEKLK